MDFDGYKSFEEFFKCFGFNSNQSGNNTPPGAPQGPCDIPGGFQDLDPMAFATIGEIIANIMAANLPFNVQNSVANWLMLVGQAMLVYNAQQQYFQTGPGRYYDIRNKNVTNPFVHNNQTSDESGNQRSKFTDTGQYINRKHNRGHNENENNNENSSSSSNSYNEVEALTQYVYELTKKIDILQQEINELKSKND